MATSKDFHDYIMEQLSRVGEVSSRKMMGEYCVYYRGKMVADLCDNQLLLKPTPSVLRLLPDAPRAYPYEGSKTLMVVVEDVENAELLRSVLNAMYDELPESKKK
ncbi:MAG: TfoX/Sxy family protein [Oscillospiraceae bacterium]|nr:TfoX/Sxy family protein [Oscillospiraceae bacterium]